MSELIREIQAEDIPKIKALLNKASKDSNYIDIKRLGGMTNHSYKITLQDEEELLVRIPGEGTEDMISRIDERISTELGCSLGIDSELMYFGDDGGKVMRFIRNPQPMSQDVMKRDENLMQAADIFRRLHLSGVDTGVRFEVFEMAKLYERIISDGHVDFYDDYEYVKQNVFRIKAEIDRDGQSAKVPCHNDPLIDNWVLDETGKLYLIDWEYSGMNEDMWDLSCLSIEADYTEEHDDKLLKAYFFNRDVSIDKKKRFFAAKLYVDFLWTLWGLTRVPFDGEFMREYANNRYSRLKRNIEKYQRSNFW